MTILARAFDRNDADAWDDFSREALQATILHTRLFLNYHGDRFIDRSLIIERDGKWLGVLPAASIPNDPARVISHPGATYGGVLHQGELKGERMLAALDAVRLHYATRGCRVLLYKAVPTFYHRAPAQDDLYALFRLGARRIRCDISSTIDLQNRQPVSQRRKRSLKKALGAGVYISDDLQHLAALWDVLAANLDRKHGVNPVHSLSEIALLAKYFPDNIRCICGMLKGMVVAGVLLFITPTTVHAQYIASSEVGYDCAALDAVFKHCIEAAQNEGKRWFDFGISTENDGRVLNDGLYEFKSGFGGGGTLHEHFELDLE